MGSTLKVKLISGENALKQIRQALGMSQRQFAQAIGATHYSIHRWEHGQTKAVFSIPQIKALAREMEKIGLTIYDLPDDLQN
jgi:transcriptional regulator with XRE-family HTH domain